MTQCKDIPDLPILKFIRDNDPGTGVGWWDMQPRDGYQPTVRDAMPPDIPDKLALAKMRMLMRRGLVNGCTCGCRGDFTLTDKGRVKLVAAA